MSILKLSAALAVAAVITLSGVKTAYGELVFEDDLNTETSNSVERQGFSAGSERTHERAEMSRSEAMRRQRLREELKNEDMLTRKLEELRLKDEMRRTQELLGSGEKKGSQSDSLIPEQRVGSVASGAEMNNLSSQAQVPTPTAVGAMAQPITLPSQPIPTITGPTNSSVATATVEESSSSTIGKVSVAPRFGMANLMGSIYDIQSNLALGLGLGVDVTEHIAVTVGYTYSSYSVGAGTSIMTPYGAGVALQRLQMKDNIFDFGGRGYLFSTQQRFRPFVGAGLAYRRGFVNYDSATLARMNAYNMMGTQDVTLSGLAGYIETGVEFKLSKMIALHGSFKFFNMLSSRQSNAINPNAFLSGNNSIVGTSALNYTNDARTAAGNALSNDNFYQLMGGVSVMF